MEKIINSVEESIKNENWYAVLMTVLTLPDIAGKIDYPKINSSKERYVKWYQMYVQDFYTRKMPNLGNYVFLTGSDCYALRCSFLHEGGSSISHQKAKEVLDNFAFLAPKKGAFIHRNKIDNTLQLQIDEFAKDILKGVKNWLVDIKSDKIKNQRINDFLKFM